MVQSTVSPAETVRNHPDTEIVAKHTPTPWKIGDRKPYVEIWGPMRMNSSPILASMEHEPREANAAFIVKAVNSYDALVKRIERLEADLNECREYLESEMDVVDGDYGEPSPNRAMQLVSMIDETLNGRPI